MEMIQGSRCPRCGWIAVPPVRICPKHPVETDPVEVPGHGSVLSFTSLASAPEGFKAPMQIALVELPGGARIFCHSKQERGLKIGRRVVIEQVDGILYFADLDLADRVALFWKRAGTTRSRAAGAMKGTAKRLIALAKVLKGLGASLEAQKTGEPERKASGQGGLTMNSKTSTTQPPLLSRARLHAGHVAIIDQEGLFPYERLLDASARVATALLSGAGDLSGARIPFLVAPGFQWVAVQWGIWRAGGIAVPLPLGFPAPELEYFIDDTQAAALVADAAGKQVLAPIAATRRLRLLSCEDAVQVATGPLPEVGSTRRAMILYTSGTTSRPKGVVTTHDNITAQITSLVRAWEWTAADHVLLCLPLHHIHGIINVLSCALWSGATCEMLPRFDANAVWERIAGGRLSLFMAVPTIYVKLIAAWDAASPQRRQELSRACAGLRLMVSGSAALPVATLNRWKEISGHTLLERYGMTEIGMALSNPLQGERVPGSVGAPLPGVRVQLVDEGGQLTEPGTPGEIEVRGPGVFFEYWGKPEATRQAFRDCWFRTGDIAVFEDGRYRILGRMNIDIIKTGGQKVSALEIEEQLREHPSIAECAVVGLPDPEWGERIAAAAVLRNGDALDLDRLRDWARERLANYKIPSRLLVLDALPRNAMGKVTKTALVDMFKSAPEGERVA
jgi:malonyl-CoA/methylmalonyl-CoA synthetase